MSFNFFLLSSSHGSNPSSYPHYRLPSRPCRCLIFHRFSLTSSTEHVLKHPSKLKFMKLSFQWAIIDMKRVPNKRVVSILLRGCNLSNTDFRCAALNVSAISSCTGLQNWLFLMCWKGDFMELLNINFSFILHLWTRAQILMETATSLSSLVDD
jgi:hypothetical protein